MDKRDITVGEVAQRAGVSAKAVRLYEARGILPPAERTESGYRTYSDHDVEIVRFSVGPGPSGFASRRSAGSSTFSVAAPSPAAPSSSSSIATSGKSTAPWVIARKDLVRALDAAKSSARRSEDVVVCPIIESEAASG